MNKKITSYGFGLFSILVGIYPVIYFFIDRKFGLLGSKAEAVLTSLPWNIGFYAHIIFAGIALLIGWAQFSKSLRTKYLKLHRLVGKTYIFSVLVSGVSGIYVAFYATGGLISTLGFMSLGVIWLYTTLKAYIYIKNGEIKKHQILMIYSFAGCFAAVTLRLWLPILVAIFQDFEAAYKIVAWLCWLPNMLFAFIITKRMHLSY